VVLDAGLASRQGNSSNSRRRTWGQAPFDVTQNALIRPAVLWPDHCNSRERWCCRFTPKLDQTRAG